MTVCLLFAEQIEHFTEVNRVDELASKKARVRSRQVSSPGVEDPEIASAASLTRAQMAMRKKAEAEEKARKSSSLQARRARLAAQSTTFAALSPGKSKRMISA